MMQDAYLEGIEMIGTRVKHDFDLIQFKKDVEAIFAVDKWYELVMEPSN
ncbi:MAG: hypothetical protein R2828_16735 [Saprospiraceae bacterium]